MFFCDIFDTSRFYNHFEGSDFFSQFELNFENFQKGVFINNPKIYETLTKLDRRVTCNVI